MAQLVIVESPKKARTIQKLAGTGYRVVASFGHVRDLPQKRLGVDVEAGFRPEYVPVPRARERLAALRRDLGAAESVLLATDPDREGEAIAWHLSVALGIREPRRVTFHAITADAVRTGLRRPRPLDRDLVAAQEARRVLVRLVGYQVSPILWRKLARGTSAGRVQSAALRLIVARELEIESFVPRPYWLIDVDLAPAARPRQGFTACLVEIDGRPAELGDEAAAGRAATGLERAAYEVEEVGEKAIAKGPPPPFTTSTLQQAASRRYRLPGQKTMQLAQSLYEDGLITYHRTDAVRVEPEAVEAARGLIGARFGSEFLPERPRAFRNRVQNAQEAHEAIRPTDPAQSPETLRDRLRGEEARLYELIWQRFVASQMAEARYRRQDAIVAARDGATLYRLRAQASTLVFPGWLAIYGRDVDTPGADDNPPATFDEATDSGPDRPPAADPTAERGQDERPGVGEPASNARLPELTVGEPLEPGAVRPSRHQTLPPARFTEASLIRALERAGVGRPSTYATIVATLLDRSYVDTMSRGVGESDGASPPSAAASSRTSRKRGGGAPALAPSALGRAVDAFLCQHFASIVDLGFTAQMEAGLDAVSRGERPGRELLAAFYGPFRGALAAAGASAPTPIVASAPVPPVPRAARPKGRRGAIGAGGSTGEAPPARRTPRRATSATGRRGPSAKRSGKPGRASGADPASPDLGTRRVLRAQSARPAPAAPPCPIAAADQASKPRDDGPRDSSAQVVCPACGRAMVQRAGPYGAFLGCSGFPACRATRPL